MTVRELVYRLRQHPPDVVVAIPLSADDGPYVWKLAEEVEGDADDHFKPNPDNPSVGNVGNGDGPVVVTIW